MFLKKSTTPIYTNFGRKRAENTQFFGQIPPPSRENPRSAPRGSYCFLILDWGDFLEMKILFNPHILHIYYIYIFVHGQCAHSKYQKLLNVLTNSIQNKDLIVTNAKTSKTAALHYDD